MAEIDREIGRLAGAMEGVKTTLGEIKETLDQHSAALGHIKGKQAKVEGGLIVTKLLATSAIVAVAAKLGWSWIAK